ncbi:MAG TPA: hypothetical protein VF103_11095 [Polyangiaceae bacterium]
MVTGGFGRRATAGLFVSFVAVACGAKSTRIIERNGPGKGGEAGTEGSVGGSAGALTGGRGGSTSSTGGVSAGGVAGTSGGAPTGGRGGSGAGGVGGTGAVGGTMGEAGDGGIAGEGGAPVDPCNTGEVRCRTHRERCSVEREWVAEEYVCTTAVSGSTEFPVACAVKAEGPFTCFGRPNDDYYASRLRLGLPPGRFVDIDVADEVTTNHSVCGITAEGFLTCWGEDPGPGSGTFVRVAASLYGTCGITDTLGISCPMGGDLLRPPTDRGPFVDIDASNSHLFAVRQDGSVYVTQDFYALPAGKYVQVSAGGDNACGIRDDGTLGCNNGMVVPVAFASVPFTHVAVEYYRRVCGIRPDGTILCFSGSPDYTSFEPPTGKFVKITATSGGMCAIRTDGSLACWGDTPLAAPEGW